MVPLSQICAQALQIDVGLSLCMIHGVWPNYCNVFVVGGSVFFPSSLPSVIQLNKDILILSKKEHLAMM